MVPLCGEVPFKHTVNVQLRFNDSDALGHVNNSVYFSFYDLGKTEYFRTIRPEINPRNADVVVAHAEVDFLAQVFLTDEIAVQTTVCKIGTKSFELLQRIIDIHTEEVKCVCRTVMVGFDFRHNCSIPISDEWRNAITEFEGREF